jgi:hypothetical protein
METPSKKSGAPKDLEEEELRPTAGGDKLELLLCARIWFPSKVDQIRVLFFVPAYFAKHPKKEQSRELIELR